MTTTDRISLGGALQVLRVRFTRDDKSYITDEGVSSEFGTDARGVLDFQVELCQPNLELLAFICGDTTADSWTSHPFDMRPVDISVWSARISNGAVIGYYRWDCACDGLSFRGVRLEERDFGMICLGGAVEEGSFSLHVEDKLPSEPFRGFTN